MSSRPRRAGRSTRRAAAAAVAVALLTAACGGGGRSAAAAPACTATAPGGRPVVLDAEQAANAATIAAVAQRLGLADHAVTIALATAMQESKLRNLPYGDRDSLGLFQQRPSQGWGSAEQVTSPAYAAGAFYRRLTRVQGWDDLPVTVAAQAVQHSAYPDAYGAHEEAARVLARALTGQVPAALTCAHLPTSEPRPDDARRALTDEMGAGALRTAGPRAWAAAGWLVAHAADYGLTSVTAAGQTWSASSGRWAADPLSGSGIAVT